VPVTNNWDSRRIAIERHIAEGASRIARMRDLMRDTASRGGDISHAERLLVARAKLNNSAILLAMPFCGPRALKRETEC